MVSKCYMKKLSDAEVIDRFSRAGYTLLSIYRHSRSPVKVRCSVGHVYSVWPCAFFAGIRCARCKRNHPVTHAEFRDRVEKAGFLIESGLVKNESNFVTLICPRGHRFTSSWRKFKLGYRCKHCLKTFYDTDKIQRIAKSRNIKLLSTSYLGYKKKHDFECPRGHRYSQTWEKFMDGKGCKYRSCYRYPKPVISTDMPEVML